MRAGDLKAEVERVLPCPWCGDPLTEAIVQEGSTFRWRKVSGCCADGPEVRRNTMTDDQAAAEIESHAKAIAAWNTRPHGPTIAALAERLAVAEADSFVDVLNKAWAELPVPISLTPSRQEYWKAGARAAILAAQAALKDRGP